MRLAIVTSVPHAWHDDRWWAAAPFVLELNRWSRIFDRLVLVAPVAEARPDRSAAPYETTAAVEVEPTERLPSFEQRRTSPLRLIRMIRAVRKAGRRTDAIQVRAPSNAALAALLIAPFLSRFRVGKYAGQWSHYPAEPRSFQLQRALLRSRWWGGPVLVYSEPSETRARQIPCFNTVLDAAAMERARRASERPRLSSSARLLYVGRLTSQKGVDALIEAMTELDGKHAELDLLGRS